VIRLIEEIIGTTLKINQLKTRLLEYLISYAVHQFGDRVPGKDYRERENGERVNNYMVEIDMLHYIYSELADIYLSDGSLSALSRYTLRFPLCEKMLDLLRPWSEHLDSNLTSRIDKMTTDQINEILEFSVVAECNIALIYMHRRQLNLAETHCQRCLTCARLYEGTEEEKADLLCEALNKYYFFRREEGNYDEAFFYAEEAYNCVAVAYNPVHPKVQTAASTLIECLTRKGDLDKAELFAQMTLDSLKDSKNRLDQHTEAVAKGYFDLATVIHKQPKGDYVKAEKLARESLRIRVLINGHNFLVGYTATLLASILMSQGKLGPETKELFEQSLAISIRNSGPDGVDTAISYFNSGLFNRKLGKEQQTAETRKEHLCLSVSMIKEALRIYTKIYGPDDPRTLQYSSELSTTARLLSES
jgi:tetratricopeptide (TPR) repeat protein